MSSANESFVQVGVVAGAHGHDGRLRIQPETDNPARFRPGAQVWIGGRPFTVQRTGGTPDAPLVKLAGVDSRGQAASLSSEPVLVPQSDVPRLPEDSYYHYELIDLTVVDENGAELGRLAEVITTGANDVYVVVAEGRELLVPAIGDVVREVSVADGRMTIAVPEGLEWREVKPAAERRRRPRRRPQP